jgi:hypothetical protein
MSSLKDKLYNYEQVPPANAWDKIAAALDESHIADKFPSKLYNTEVAPPVVVWDKIAVTLDESHITDQFPSKLYNAEVAPPAGVWNKIASSLEPEQATAIPMRSKSFSFFRYAAAAVVIGLVAFGVIKWANSNNSNSNGGIAGTKSSTPGNKKKSGSPIETNPAEINNVASGDNTDEVAATRQVKTTSAKRTKNNYSITDNIDAAQPIYAYNEHTPNLADRYIMLMTPDGGIIRMSKKWGNLVCCVSGQEQDADCKDQLKKWQEKIACSPVASSNFMDILSLASTLNETEL